MFNKKLIINSTILSTPGIIAIFISLVSIPAHLSIAGIENYGNYIFFHIFLTLSFLFNFGIAKSIVISANNFPKFKNQIAGEGLNYTLAVCLIIFLITLIVNFFFKNIISSYEFFYIELYVFGLLTSLIFLCFEGILQGNEKFKLQSLFNFIFYSLALSAPSIMLIFFQDLTLKKLIIISNIIKFISILLMFFVILKNNLLTQSKKKLLLNNLKKNSKWLTLNSILVQFYDVFDKYLIKIFLGPVYLATYSIPQQITGKLSVLSKGFSAFLLPFLSRKNHNNKDFNTSLTIFIKIFPIFIFLLFPFYSILLKLWLGEQYNQEILVLTKIFSLSIIFGCASHILITKFEASQTLRENLKFESFLLPFFLLAIFLLILNSFSLITISLVIFFKELVLLILRINFFKKKIPNVRSYYFYLLIFNIVLFFFVYDETLFIL